MVVRGMMYLISFITVIFALLMLMPDKRHPFIFLGRNTMGIYFFHYPIMILMNGLMILNIPQLDECMGVIWSVSSVCTDARKSSVDWVYTNVMGLITFILFKREKKVEDEGLEDEYDSEEEDRFAVLAQRRMAIEELAATWDTSFDAEEKEDHEEGQS